MFKSEFFQFQTNVSLDIYQSKTDAIACLSSKGAAAIGKNKMAFKVQTVTVGQFISLAINGHAFCNLFQYDPTIKYWIQSKEGKWYLEYPEYQKGANKGGMKLCMKRDEYFAGAQTIFVDVDYTRYNNVHDYISTLKYTPTCVYMSFSDRKEKQGRVSRRFRMVYVFEQVLNKKEFYHISQTINDQIVFDTSESMDDDCGTRMSQYMNGVYGNNEVYISNIIYSVTDFPEEQPEWTSAVTVDKQQQSIVFDEKILSDMGSYNSALFLHYYSWKYPYKYRTEKPDWIDGKYQLTDENYLQLWWYREPQVDGQHRRRKLFKNACLRRLMYPDMTPDAALYNLYLDFVRFFDNSDHAITPDCLVRKVKHAFEKTTDQLIAYCDREIRYWREHRPQFIIRTGYPCNWGVIANIRKRIRWGEIDNLYDRTLSVQQNIQNGIGISETTLYRYCKANFINTNPNKGETYVEQRAAKRKEKLEMIEKFKRYFDPNATIKENQKRLEAFGVELSTGAISAWKQKYYQPEQKPVFNFPPVTYEVPTFDNILMGMDFDVDIPDEPKKEETSGDSTQIEAFSWWKSEYIWH